ncbi:H-NS histone family protein [Roseinatronobacter sp.]|uniref:H-NS histone family protein n=1 Tax=Roseinatronobacter sp. TaxID=1945755 RepID=UPI0025FF1E30|nr:H-NS histone family protein [Roseibaca sp.]
MSETKQKPMTAAEMRAEAEKLMREAQGIEQMEKKTLRAEVEDTITKRGYTLVDIFPELDKGTSSSSSGKTRSKMSPKFRDPENPDNTWTGVGREPNWLKDKLAAGATREDFLIAK